MALYEKILNNIVLHKKIKKDGGYLGIPFPFPRLNEYLVGIDRGTAIGVLGATGVGKSYFTRYVFLYSVYKFYKETGYKLRIIWFSLEDSKEQVYDFVICNYLREFHDIHLLPKELHSKTRELPDFVVEKLHEAKAYFEDFEKIVTFIDGVTEPSSLYDICKGIALNLGKVTSYKEVIEGKEVKQYKYESDTHVIAVFDNQSNIDTEDGTSNEQAAILKFVKEYMRLKLCNFFRWTCVLVQQLDFESERQAFTRSGETIMSKIEPSLASIGDSKRSARSLHLVFSLFDPSRYDLIQYPIPSKKDPENCYRIDILGNKFRALKILKSNFSDSGMRLGMMFDPIGGSFTELPKPKSEEIQHIYKNLTAKILNKQEKSINFAEEEDKTPF